jgi:phosphate transport system substrate-binding protein
MTSPLHLPRRAGIVACIAVALYTLVGGVMDAGAATGPSVVVTPATGLGNGQFVKIAWSGFAPGALAYFRQCVASPTNIHTDCTGKYQVSPASDNNGRGSIYLPVFRGTIVSETAGTTFDCSGPSCAMAVLGNPDDLGTGVLGALNFAPSPDACPDEGDTTVLGGGASAPGTALMKWSGIVCQPPQSLPVAYSMSDSPNGRLQFAADNYDYAGTSTPFTFDEQKDLYQQHKAYTYAPVTESGLVLGYRMFERGKLGDQGPQITDLRLTPSDIARIFTGRVDNWDRDAHINAINPAHAGKLPLIVQPLVRGDHSAATYEFTQWLTEAAPNALPKTWQGVTDTYPTGTYLPAANGKETADELALSIAAPSDDNAIYFGYIGYIDSSLAAYYGVPTVKIMNAAGKYVSATPDSIRAAVHHLKKNPDKSTYTPDYLNEDPKAYPLPTVSYLAVPTNGEDSAKAGALADFIRWDVTDGQGADVLPQGYVPLDPGLVAQAKKAATAVEAQSGTPTKAVNNEVEPPSHQCESDCSPLPPPPPGGGPQPPTVPSGPSGPSSGPTPSGPSPSCTPSPSGASPSASASPSTSPSTSPSASPTVSPTPSHCSNGPKVDKVVYPSTSSNASRLLIRSLGALALLGFAAGPGVQLASRKGGFKGPLRQIFRRGLP